MLQSINKSINQSIKYTLSNHVCYTYSIASMLLTSKSFGKQAVFVKHLCPRKPLSSPARWHGKHTYLILVSRLGILGKKQYYCSIHRSRSYKSRTKDFHKRHSSCRTSVFQRYSSCFDFHLSIFQSIQTERVSKHRFLPFNFGRLLKLTPIFLPGISYNFR